MPDDTDRIEKITELAAPVPRVWQALTDHDQFGEWFGVKLDGPFALGKTTRGFITQPGHEDMQWVSVTEELTPERCFAFSWPPDAVDPETDYPADAKVTVVFSLQSTPQGTRLSIVESGFSQFPDHKRLDILRSNIEGWNIQAANIGAYVSK